MRLHIRLFGRLTIRNQGEVLTGCSAGKVPELLCYLLLHRDQPLAREGVASKLWGDYCTTTQSKKQLRHTLWQLQNFLKQEADFRDGGIFDVGPEWIQLRSDVSVWVDVEAFERIYSSVRGIDGRRLETAQRTALVEAVELYEGHLLESWYCDWCLDERERLRQIYLLMLDKLVDHFETKRQVEEGLHYASLVLQHDRARERTHRQMMRLYVQFGDRTGALRQYERCKNVLREELDVAPSSVTNALFEDIRQNGDGLTMLRQPMGGAPSLAGLSHELRQIQKTMDALREQMRDISGEVTSAMERRDEGSGRKRPGDGAGHISSQNSDAR